MQRRLSDPILGLGTLALVTVLSFGGTFLALAQQNPSNLAPAPVLSQYGCPTQNQVGVQGVVCAAPGNTGGFAPTGDGSLGVGGHFYSRSNMLPAALQPSIGSCGTSPALASTSTDVAGIITTGTGAPTTCAVVFGQPFVTAPHVFVEPEFTGSVASVVPTATGFTITLSVGATSAKIDYFVVGVTHP
jgi:hypothetical protein